MSVVEIIASVLIGAGLLLGVLSAIGLNRFDGVLMRIHAASKPQVLGLILVFAGAALAAGAWSIAAFLLVVLLAQMLTPSDDDDDEDGFVDESDDDHEDLHGGGQELFPENVVTDTVEPLTGRNWEEPEGGAADVEDEDGLDIDLDDETELEAEEVAERDERR